MLGKTEHLHFVGIGGIGMSGLALLLHNLKFKITGSDISRSAITKRLKKFGIKVYYQHRKENITNADVVVYSTAIKADNPELLEARARGLPVIHRSELLAELTRIKTSICVSGTHGKTTTSSMIAEVLQRAGLSPTTMIGGIVKGKAQARLGRGKYLVCEADESDKSFLKLLPSYAVVTNIEPEHLEYYKDLDEIKENFVDFANRVPFWGSIFLCADSAGAMDIKERLKPKVILYGLNDNAQLKGFDLKPINFGSGFKVSYLNKPVGNFRLRLPGRHNVTNSIAAIGIALELEIPVSRIKEALQEFKGVHRRIEFCGRVNSIEVYDDYGHHPTEIAVTLQTLHEYFPDRRIISVFQPHRYTRTYHLFDQFAYAFLSANIVIVTDIYPAHELPIPGVSGESLAKRISKEQEDVYYIADFGRIISFLKKNVKPNDLVVIQGAGNITTITKRLLKGLK